MYKFPVVKPKEEVAEKIVEKFMEVHKAFKLSNLGSKEEIHIKEYLKYIVKELL